MLIKRVFEIRFLPNDKEDTDLVESFMKDGWIIMTDEPSKSHLSEYDIEEKLTSILISCQQSKIVGELSFINTKACSFELIEGIKYINDHPSIIDLNFYRDRLLIPLLRNGFQIASYDYWEYAESMEMYESNNLPFERVGWQLSYQVVEEN